MGLTGTERFVIWKCTDQMQGAERGSGVVQIWTRCSRKRDGDGIQGKTRDEGEKPVLQGDYTTSAR